MTLTNLKEKDWNRISTQNLSPLFISIHATDPDIREELLKNKNAREILNHIKWFEKHSLQIHAQIVVCPTINDNEILEKSILDLSKFWSKEKQTVLSLSLIHI